MSLANTISTWSASPQPIPPPHIAAPEMAALKLSNQTLRLAATISLGGQKPRLVLSNLYGTAPLKIDAAHVALARPNGAIEPGSGHAVAFDGKPQVDIPPGAEWISDPVAFPVAPLSRLAVSLYFRGVTPVATTHLDGHDTAYVAEGDRTGDATIAPSATMTAKPFLTGIRIDAPAAAKAIVAFGDSLTDGDGSTIDQARRWPDFLARRIVKAGLPLAIVNAGISGARLLADGLGVNALARFDRDVIAEPRVGAIICLIGLNDIGWPGTVLDPSARTPDAAELIHGYRQLIGRAQAHGLRIIGATLTPFGEAFKGGPNEGFHTARKETVRLAVNGWIRTSGAFDGVIDFDALARDPARPSRLKAEFNSGDNLHPNDAAYEAMAAAIDLGMLMAGAWPLARGPGPPSA